MGSCDKCGIDHCYDCKQTLGVTYPHAVFFTGSEDGYYCNTCDRILTKDGKNARFQAYQLIGRLRLEHDRFDEDFKRRREQAELALKKLQPK